MRESFRFVYQGYTVSCHSVRLPSGRYAPRATILPPPSTAAAPTQWERDDTTFATEESAAEFAGEAVRQQIDHMAETDWTPLP
jgi:hypothetical protein